MCDQQRLRPACTYAQSDQSLCSPLEFSMSVKLLTEHHLEFLSLKGGCTCSSESTLIKCHIVENHTSRLILCLCLLQEEMKLGRNMRAAPRGFSAQMGDSNTNKHFTFMFTSGGDETRA